MDTQKVALVDELNYKRIRDNVKDFISRCAAKYDSSGKLLLDIAPQDHEGAEPFFKKTKIETLDISPNARATFTADLCQNNKAQIPSNRYDYVVCTEVLEHTKQPFNAVKEIKRLLKKGGICFVSTPYDFRIHGPLPDCWRFTEHGLRELFKSFDIIDISGLENNERFLMPTHYTLIARKKQ